MKPILRIYWNGGSAREVRLPTEGLLTLGSSRRADISIPDPTLSGLHCAIVRGRDGVYLHDLHSCNGTLINGSKLPCRSPLLSGDLIQAGYVTIIYLTEAGEVVHHE